MMMAMNRIRQPSRRDFLRLAGSSLALTALAAGCSRQPGLAGPPPTLTSTPLPAAQPATPAAPTATPVPTTEPTPTAPSAQAVGDELDFKIGQMLMIGFRGLTVGPDHFMVRAIREQGVGSVVLFDFDVPSGQSKRNIESPEQVEALVTSLQAAAETPLLVGIDYEGGLINRLKPAYGFPATVSHQYLGETNNLETTYEQAAQMGRTLADLGINLNLAPVVDLCINPDNPIIGRLQRCFSADPQIVTDHAGRFIEAHHEQGVLCTLKHFPGHGSSTADSHLGLVDVSKTWSPIELEPYIRLLQANVVDAIMTAHVFNAGRDPDYPATLSQPTLTGLLREELGYDGVIISDDMQMKAITEEYGFETAVQKAVEAGVDILAFANNSVYEEDVVERAVAVIKGLVQAGTISEARIEASYRRVGELKRRLASTSLKQ